MGAAVQAGRRLVQRVWRERRLRYGVGVLVVALVIAGVVAVRGREPTGVPQVVGHAKSPAQAGMGYLTGLAQGSARAALAYLDTRPESMVFLTDAVLAESIRLNPITDIAVLGSSRDTNTVTVRYRIGQTRVIETYSVTKSHTGFWVISHPGG